MTERKCATCVHWVGTEITVFGNPHPHQQREFEEGVEMLHATTALCGWPVSNPTAREFMESAPLWVYAIAGGGMLTQEDDGANCLGWAERPPSFSPKTLPEET